MLKSFIIGIAFLIILNSCNTSKYSPPYTVAFYNVENLFDTICNLAKLDQEFLPDSPKEWNTEKYFKKINDIARVIKSIDSISSLAVIGLCEVENDLVLNDLVKSDYLKKANYQIVWEEGPDDRGIDCALLYNPTVFKLNSFQFIPVNDPDDFSFVTRDILYAEGKINNEQFHFFVNHWPSRRGGADASTPKRVLAANILRNKVDEIIHSNPNSNIVIMGDMNDEPGDMSLSDILVALPNKLPIANTDLVNLMYDEYENEKGSYNYQGNWNMIDNLIVTGYLIQKAEGLKTSIDNGYVFQRKFMQFVSKSGEISPNRTYGRTYFGGISDHFPVYLTLE